MFKQTLLAVAVLSSLSQVALAEETSKGQILVLLSSESQMQLQDGKTLTTGYYLNEFGVPADAFLQAGYELILATPKGNAPVADEKSVTAQYFGGSVAEMQRIQQVIAAIPGIDDTLSLQEVIDGGLAHRSAVAVKTPVLGEHASGCGPAEPHRADRLFRAAAGGAGDAGDGHRPVRMGIDHRACRHGARHRLAHRTVFLDQRGRYAQQLAFGGVGVGDKTALEPLARARQVGAGCGNQSAGAALGRGQHAARGEQVGGNISQNSI